MGLIPGLSVLSLGTGSVDKLVGSIAICGNGEREGVAAKEILRGLALGAGEKERESAVRLITGDSACRLILFFFMLNWRMS